MFHMYCMFCVPRIIIHTYKDNLTHPEAQSSCETFTINCFEVYIIYVYINTQCCVHVYIILTLIQLQASPISIMLHDSSPVSSTAQDDCNLSKACGGSCMERCSSMSCNFSTTLLIMVSTVISWVILRLLKPQCTVSRVLYLDRS